MLWCQSDCRSKQCLFHHMARLSSAYGPLDELSRGFSENVESQNCNPFCKTWYHTTRLGYREEIYTRPTPKNSQPPSSDNKHHLLRHINMRRRDKKMLQRPVYVVQKRHNTRSLQGTHNALKCHESASVRGECAKEARDEPSPLDAISMIWCWCSG